VMIPCFLNLPEAYKARLPTTKGETGTKWGRG
jgi:hypothetical protein